VRTRLLHLHRQLSLALGVFWLLQALTGLALVFRWELDDASLRATPRAADFVDIGRRIGTLEAQNPGWRATSIWSSGSGGDRFDITLETAEGGERTWRVDGAGEVLRSSSPSDGLGKGRVYDGLTSFHQTLFLGDGGRWLLGASGVLLLTNLGLGLQAAWPRFSRWRATLWPKSGGPARAWAFSWHRALGLWLAVPAMALVACGAALDFEDPLRRWFGAEILGPEAAGNALDSISPEQAVARALRLHEGARISGVVFPSPESPWYRIWLLTNNEPRQAFGRTTVWVAGDGEVIARYRPADAPPAARLMDSLYPLHTGQAFGLWGRTLAAAIAIWLIAMGALGVSLWSARRSRARDPVPRDPVQRRA